MKVLGTIGTFVVGAAAGFATCGYLTVRGVLNSERHRKALADMVAKKLSEELFTERTSTSRVSYKPYHKRTPRYYVSYRNYYDKERVTMNAERGPIDIIFKSSADAATAFDNIKQLVEEYGQVSVADVCDICELESNNTDNNYGWTHVSDMYIDNFDRCTLHLSKPLTIK